MSRLTYSKIKDRFKSIAKEKGGFIPLSELRFALDECGFKIPTYKARHLMEEYDKNHSSEEKGKLNYNEFELICRELWANDPSSTFEKAVSKKENLETLGGISAASSEGTTHSVRLEEQIAFSDWINTNLAHDKDVQHLLPIDPEGKNLYDKVKDGILLCKIVNHSCPDTIDERTINKKNLTVYRSHENLILALSSAQSIGCNIVNIDAFDLKKGSPHLVLGLLWQIIRIGLFNQITLENCPGLARLLQDGERIEDLLKLSPEEILLRWVNYHLENAGIGRRCNNFYSDITDSEIYCHLIHQIAPKDAGVTLEALMESNHMNRAEIMLQQAVKIDCRSFVTASDVVNGVHKLNLAFVANMFNKYPSLDKCKENNIEGLEAIEESREEKTYRNWINSMGVSPYVNWLYSDLTDGLVFFQLFDVVKPGVVDWNVVHKEFSKLREFMEKLENCNYVVKLGKEMNFSLVGIAGQDLNEGNVTLTLALIWQLMRAYMISMLHSIFPKNTSTSIEARLIELVNKFTCHKFSIKSFQDSSIADSKIILDLINRIKPGLVNYDLVKEGGNEQDNLENAKYALSLARKMGARVYALPEHITEVNQKMVMTIFACILAKVQL